MHLFESYLVASRDLYLHNGFRVHHDDWERQKNNHCHSNLDDRQCCLRDETRDIMPEVYEIYETCWSGYFGAVGWSLWYNPYLYTPFISVLFATICKIIFVKLLPFDVWRGTAAEKGGMRKMQWDVGCLLGDEQRADLFSLHEWLSQTIHGTGVFTYIYHKNQPNVGKYIIHGSYGFLPPRKLSEK